MEKPRLKKNKNEEVRIIERERGENKQKKQNHTQREKEEERGWERRMEGRGEGRRKKQGRKEKRGKERKAGWKTKSKEGRKRFEVSVLIRGALLVSSCMHPVTIPAIIIINNSTY